MCEHTEELYYFHNDGGWKCFYCNAKIGENHSLDKNRIEIKISNIMMDLQEMNEIDISSSTEADEIEHKVLEMCNNQNRYDSQYIISCIYKKIKKEDLFTQSDESNKL